MSPLQNVVSQMIPTLRGRGYPNGRHMQGSRFVLLGAIHLLRAQGGGGGRVPKSERSKRGCVNLVL